MVASSAVVAIISWAGERCLLSYINPFSCWDLEESQPKSSFISISYHQIIAKISSKIFSGAPPEFSGKVSRTHIDFHFSGMTPRWLKKGCLESDY